MQQDEISSEILERISGLRKEVYEFMKENNLTLDNILQKKTE